MRDQGDNARMQEFDNALTSFHGDYCHGIDQSRRVAIPARWRPKDPHVLFRVLLWPIGSGQFLLVLPPDRWQLMINKLKTRSLQDTRVAAAERIISANSAPLVLDRVGRFCLPDKLAKAAGLETQAQFVGRLDKFEIWNPERYQAHVQQDTNLAASILGELDL